MHKGDFIATSTPRRVAIIGGGVSGLAAAWHLQKNAPNIRVELFEAEDRLGGHAYTLNVDGTDVDIGFMVFNDSNYPNMTKWFESLSVPAENTDMSLSVSLDGGKTVEWNSDGLNGLLARRWQAVEPSFYSMISDMIRFNKHAADILLLPEDDPRKYVTTGQYLRNNGYSEAFGKNYLLPMMAAIWSASMEDVLQFPAAKMISFFCNHKLLQIFDRPQVRIPHKIYRHHSVGFARTLTDFNHFIFNYILGQWKTVAGRSQKYTLKMQELLGKHAHTSIPIISMSQVQQNDAFSYELFTSDAKSVGTFDEVIFACHTNTTSSILQTMETVDKNLLDLVSSIEYADNSIYVHSDPKLMPSRRRAWASWNCLGKSELLSNLKFNNAKAKESFEGGESGFGNKANNDDSLKGTDERMKAVYVTYWLNRLQNLDTDKDIFVSLNPHEKPSPELTHRKLTMAHPQFTPATLLARKTLQEEFQGKDGLWFCGAWGGYGFHEDGCRSGFQVATELSGVPLPWSNMVEKVLPPPDLALIKTSEGRLTGVLSALYKRITHDLPIAVCKRFMLYFLRIAVTQGNLRLKLNDGTLLEFGDGTPCGSDGSPVTLRVFDDWMFVKIAWEYDLGLARSYMAGHFVVEPLSDPSKYNQVLRPPHERDETNVVIGDPVGLTRLLLLIIGNRDRCDQHIPAKSIKGYASANALNAGLLLSKIGSFLNFLRYKLTMDNSEKGGSLKNIHAHYDLSNDLFTSFLDKETLMYSSAIYDAVKAPGPQKGLVFRGSLEEAQWRKLDTLLDRAQVQPGQYVLDIGFGWGGLSLHAAKKYGCKVTGITLSVEQKDLAMKRVKKEGLEDLITFEVIDYRTFARQKRNLGKFDRVLSCEMIEAVGHEHLPEFYWAVEQVLKPNGVLVMEAITTTEERYEEYLRSTDFINTVIFPGGCSPTLHALVDAAYKGSRFTLEHIDNIGLHYAQTLADWRRRFNANEKFVRSLGFDDIFFRAWNYYFSYCEAGFFARNVNCLILVFARQGCTELTPLYETRAVTQFPALTEGEVQNWLSEAK